jgi:hypothetical protein
LTFTREILYSGLISTRSALGTNPGAFFIAWSPGKGVITVNDQEFLAAFEQHTLQEFPHRSHIRMAWLYLRRDGFEIGSARIQHGIQAFAAAHGAHRKYHQTITEFWMRLVQHAIDCHPEISDFEAFLALCPFLLNGKIIASHYSPSMLHSEEARQHWIAPDLIPMP